MFENLYLELWTIFRHLSHVCVRKKSIIKARYFYDRLFQKFSLCSQIGQDNWAITISNKNNLPFFSSVCSTLGWRLGLQTVTGSAVSLFFLGLFYRSASLYHPQRRAILHLKGTSINHVDNFWTFLIPSLSHCTKCVLQTNLHRVRMVYIFRTGMNSTFTCTMPNKSISVLPINIKFQKTIHCYKILGKIIDCVWPAPRILYQWILMKYRVRHFNSNPLTTTVVRGWQLKWHTL